MGADDRINAYVLPRWFVWIAGVLMFAGSPWAGWVTLSVADHTTAFAVMEASRFTSRDGAEVWKAIADIKTQIAVLPSPASVSRIEEKQQQLLQRLAVIETLLRERGGKPDEPCCD